MKWDLPSADTYFHKILQATPEGFEIDHLDFALQYCNKYRTAIDGGAHVGTWSVHMAKRFSRVLAFEPALDTYWSLKANTAAFGNVTAVNSALGARKGQCIIVDDPTRQGNTGSRMIAEREPDVEHTLKFIPVCTIDSLGLSDLDFLKLDVEGFELEALRGARQTIFDNRPVIVVECKEFTPPRNGGTILVREFLAQAGYIEAGGIRNDRVFIPA